MIVFRHRKLKNPKKYMPAEHSLYSNMYTMCTLCTSTFMLGASVQLSLPATFKLRVPKNVQCSVLGSTAKLSLSLTFKL